MVFRDEFGYNGYSQGYNFMCVAYVGVMIFVFLIPNEEIAISQFIKEYLTVHNRDKLKKINSEGEQILFRNLIYLIHFQRKGNS